jgi:signal transduction histidine kinase
MALRPGRHDGWTQPDATRPVRRRQTRPAAPIHRRHLEPPMSLTRRHFATLAAAVSLTLATAAAHAEDRAKPEEAKALLAKAVGHIKAVGRDKAYADFMNKAGPWVDRDLYITVFDLEGKTLAHGANARMVGKDNINLQDANGKFHIKERLEIAKTKGRGQQEFAFLNPMTKQIEPKLMFFERIDDIVVACGAYRPA